MMAGFSCPICSESLSKLPAEAAQKNKGKAVTLDGDSLNISAAPCGHIFHSYCIQKWLSGSLLSSSKCPCCRKDIINRQCLPLYPTLYEESFMNDSLDGSSSNCNHMEELSLLRSKVTTLQASLKEQSQLNDLLSEDFSKLNEKSKTDRIAIETWMLRAKQHESYKDIVRQQEKQIEEFQNKMKTFTEIDKILRGNLDDIECDMTSYPPNTQSIKSLLETKCALTLELRRSARHLEDSKREKQLHMKEKASLKKEIDELKKESKDMQKAFANSTFGHSQKQMDSFGQKSSQERPKKVFCKRKGTSPEISHNGNAIDSDVDIIESPLPKSKKSEKNTKVSKSLNNATILVSSDTDDDFMSPLNFRVKSSVAGLPPITPPTRYNKGHSSIMNRGYLAAPK